MNRFGMGAPGAGMGGTNFGGGQMPTPQSDMSIGFQQARNTLPPQAAPQAPALPSQAAPQAAPPPMQNGWLSQLFGGKLFGEGQDGFLGQLLGKDYTPAMNFLSRLQLPQPPQQQGQPPQIPSSLFGGMARNIFGRY